MDNCCKLYHFFRDEEVRSLRNMNIFLLSFITVNVFAFFCRLLSVGAFVNNENGTICRENAVSYVRNRAWYVKIGLATLNCTEKIR